MSEQTWVVNGKQITLAEFRAEIEVRKTAAQPIMDAWRKGDISAVAKAQKTMRLTFK
jgi:hypothetical protein